MKEIKIFTPATVANISCGFDILGLCLDTVGDEMIVREVSEKGIKITKVTGQNLPLETHRNVAGVAGLALLEKVDASVGYEIEIYKKIKPGSGIGSSAASAAGAVFAINELLGKPFSKQELIYFAMQGEKLASGTEHADNVSPVILGGFTLVRSYEPLDILKIKSPNDLYATIIHPQIEVKTSDSRAVLKNQVSLKKLVTQMGNFGGLISGLYTNDYDLIGRSLHDEIIEPNRLVLIPEFDKVKKGVIQVGALGAGISGSGPSIFALSRGEETAELVGKTMAKIYNNTGIDYDIHVSKINQQGIKIL
ncbi:homoserine kinase [Flavobacteriaceae bacterium]|nr:homoserine kinase [Flavobacteriaceae bacterium]MDB2413448.1 homoserine kinase [Flavobacteriaceae bacterium]